MAIKTYSIVASNGYFINGYYCLLLSINGYFIGGYYCLLVVILLVAIGDHSINCYYVNCY
jgi:hypothetical protein